MFKGKSNSHEPIAEREEFFMLQSDLPELIHKSPYTGQKIHLLQGEVQPS